MRFANVRPFILYSLRHTFLARLGASRCNVWTLTRIAGDSSVAISARYVHPSADSALAAMERLSGHNEKAYGHATLGEVANCLKRLEKEKNGAP